MDLIFTGDGRFAGALKGCWHPRCRGNGDDVGRIALERCHWFGVCLGLTEMDETYVYDVVRLFREC